MVKLKKKKKTPVGEASAAAGAPVASTSVAKTSDDATADPSERSSAAGGGKKGGGRGRGVPSSIGKSRGKGKRSDAGKGKGKGKGKGGGKSKGGSAAAAGAGHAGGLSIRRRPLAELNDYIKACNRTLNTGGVSSAEEEVMLASRAMEEIGDRVLLVAADQRGSKPLEQLLRKCGAEEFNAAFERLVEALPELAPNQYASHVLEAALVSWAERLGSEDPAKRPPAAGLVRVCKSLCEDGGWPALVDDSCASHTVRSLLLALGGYAPEPKGKGKAAARAGLLPKTKHEVPPEVADARRRVACSLIEILQKDDSFCLGKNASPVVQLLLRILRDRGDRALVAEAAAAVIGSAGKTAKLNVERCEALLRSAPGSRTLEAVVETGTAELISQLFFRFFSPRLQALIAGDEGEFGPFLAQRVADSLRDEAQLTLALQKLDFTVCLKKEATQAQQGVPVKFLEACLRLRAGLKEGAAAIFKGLGLTGWPDAGFWPTLFALEPLAGPQDLLRAWKPRGNPSRHSEQGAEAAAEAAADEGQGRMVLKHLPAAGSQILGLLLRFPRETVKPLDQGIFKLMGDKSILPYLAREAKTSKVLEAALSPSSALSPKMRSLFSKAFRGMLGELGPDPTGGWLVAALWRASLGDKSLREEFAHELLAVEDELRTRNFAVWKVCGLHQAKVRSEEWAKQQDKAGKTKRLFGEIIEGGDAEAVKAAALRRAREAEDEATRKALADPLVASLMPQAGDTEDLADDAGDGGAEDQVPDGPADRRMDSLFSGQGSKRRRLNRLAVAEAPTVDTSGVKAAAKADSSLLEALQLIAGKAPEKMKKKRKKQTPAAKAAAADDDSDDD
eukprot:TRINITY_DN3269_c3_g1_i1.p1 TRINITY_DN3269_c3_g1~~TRINITY_DN3269_c3_g1_i1.p1  ORF type:complete len:844 (+),score=274.10 TRINITY_DN3269_c3_g1_i1:70-2601(+)